MEPGTRDRPLILLLGSDSVADLPNWRRPERILELAAIAEVEKPGERPLDETTELGRAVRERTTRVVAPPIAISSTLIRARVASGHPIRYLVPDAVDAYIREQSLYGGYLPRA